MHFSRPENRTPTASPQPASHPGAGAAEVNNPYKGPGSGATSEGNEGSPSASPSSAPTDPQYNSQTLAAPIQTFNKSHTPISLSQTDSTQANYPLLDSTCQSVVGATCEIHAIMGSSDIIVAGPQAISDATTGTDLPWNAKDKGLTSGTWTVKAVAKSGGQTSASTSNYTLTVNP